MARLRFNFQSGDLGAPMSDSDTTITFDEAPDFPDINNGDYAVIVVDEEIMHLVGYEESATTGVVERGREGTSPQAHGSNEIWQHTLVASDVNNAMGFMPHGDDESAPRPPGYLSVTWFGTVEPLNMQDNDFWEEGFDGTISYDVDVFTSSGVWDWVAAGEPYEVEVLVVGGGGSGGTRQGGGGGAGGVLYEGSLPVSGDVSVVVGEGGEGVTGESDGNDGGNSEFGSLVAIGGGGGGGGDLGPGRNGGSGGGGPSRSTSASRDGGSGVTNQGHDGGDGFPDGFVNAGGGGGGAGGAGETPTDGVVGGDGGIGQHFPQFAAYGEDGWFGGGGAGSSQTQNSPGVGGQGGGGDATVESHDPSPNAMPGTGGGSGSAHADTSTGNGGSGIVIVRYLRH